MTLDALELLKEFQGERQQTPEEQIQALRALARQYRDENNALVKQKWEIEEKIIKKNAPNSEKHDDEKRREDLKTLEKTIFDHHYNEKFKVIIDKIYELEVKLYGQSDVGSHSPYVL